MEDIVMSEDEVNSLISFYAFTSNDCLQIFPDNVEDILMDDEYEET